MVLAVQPQFIPTPKPPPRPSEHSGANPACMTFYMAIQYTYVTHWYILYIDLT